MRQVTLATILAVSTFALGCSGDPNGSADDESSTETSDAEGALTAKQHFAPTSAELAWTPGCGMRLPNGSACYMGLTLTFIKLQPALHTTIRTTVNNTTDVITVKLDTWATVVHMTLPANPPVTKELGSNHVQMGKHYQGRVLDYQGNVVWTGEIVPSPAP